MGTFRVEITVRNFRQPDRSRTLAALVDAAATYTTMPRDVLEGLGCQPIGTRRVLLADGREEEWPVTAVFLLLEGQEGPTFCLVGPQALRGRVTC